MTIKSGTVGREKETRSNQFSTLAKCLYDMQTCAKLRNTIYRFLCAKYFFYEQARLFRKCRLAIAKVRHCCAADLRRFEFLRSIGRFANNRDNASFTNRFTDIYRSYIHRLTFIDRDIYRLGLSLISAKIR